MVYLSLPALGFTSPTQTEEQRDESILPPAAAESSLIFTFFYLFILLQPTTAREVTLAVELGGQGLREGEFHGGVYGEDECRWNKTTYTPTKEGLSKWQRWKYAATQHHHMRSRAICVLWHLLGVFILLPSLFLYTLARYPNFF